MNYLNRQKQIRAFLRTNSLDGLLIKKRQNISYLSGIRGEDAVLFVSHKQNFIITDSRYKEEYKLDKVHLIIPEDKNIYAAIEDICSSTRSKQIGFESESFSYAECLNFKKHIKHRKMIPFDDPVGKIRVIKDADEIAHIKDACINGVKVMQYAISKIKPGRTEKTLKDIIEEFMIKKGIEKADFDFIVASGKNSSMPHAAVSDKAIRNGEMVVVDLGARYYGYNSDLTRTVFIGRITPKYLGLYNVVLDAQKKAIEIIRPGVPIKDIDAISRQYISNKGWGRYFIHSLGHGLGLETHEAPIVSKSSKLKLEENMVITIEPGIYIPGWGGIRIEDVVRVTRDGCEVLTKVQKV